MILIRYFIRLIPIKRIFTMLLVISLSITLGVKAYGFIGKDVFVNDNGNVVNAKTMSNNVVETFSQLGINVADYDYMDASDNDELNSDRSNYIFIKRAVPVTIHVDGNSRRVMTYLNTVEEVINKFTITLGPLDKYEYVNPDDKIFENMEIKIIRIREELIFEKEPVAYDIIKQPNDEMNNGEQLVVRPGSNGINEKTYRLVYEDGLLVKKELIGQEELLNPVEEIVEYGTVANFTNDNGELVRYTKSMDMRATAYTSSFADTGKNPDHPEFGICYTGMQAREGVVAVDPKVIPLHSRLYIESLVPGVPDYGFAYAGDIGSAIKNDLVDLYFDSMTIVDHWGCKKIRVYILKEQNDSRWTTTAWIGGH